MTTGCGSAEVPWILNALAGQQINVTLFDFGVEETMDGPLVKVMDSVIVISLLYVKVYGNYWTYKVYKKNSL